MANFWTPFDKFGKAVNLLGSYIQVGLEAESLKTTEEITNLAYKKLGEEVPLATPSLTAIVGAYVELGQNVDLEADLNTDVIQDIVHSNFADQYPGYTPSLPFAPLKHVIEAFEAGKCYILEGTTRDLLNATSGHNDVNPPEETDSLPREEILRNTESSHFPNQPPIVRYIKSQHIEEANKSAGNSFDTPLKRTLQKNMPDITSDYTKYPDCTLLESSCKGAASKIALKNPLICKEITTTCIGSLIMQPKWFIETIQGALDSCIFGQMDPQECSNLKNDSDCFISSLQQHHFQDLTLPNSYNNACVAKPITFEKTEQSSDMSSFIVGTALLIIAIFTYVMIKKPSRKLPAPTTPPVAAAPVITPPPVAAVPVITPSPATIPPVAAAPVITPPPVAAVPVITPSPATIPPAAAPVIAPPAPPVAAKLSRFQRLVETISSVFQNIWSRIFG